MYILDEKYLQIETVDNKLIYYSKLDNVPTEEEFEKVKEILSNYFSNIEKSQKKFYQIMKVDNATIISIYHFRQVIKWICNFFSTKHYIFENYLKCSIIIIDNKFIQKSINLLLKAYEPSRPIHFITNLDNLNDLLKLY